MLDDQVVTLRSAVSRFRSTLDGLTEDDVRAASSLPGWTRGHVLTHVARSADSRRRLLRAARAGEVGRQYSDEQTRAREIDDGVRRPAAVIREDTADALDRLLAAIVDFPADRWAAPGHWLGVGQRPVRRVVPSMRRELEYHHVDLAAGYAPDDWPPDFVTEQLDELTTKFTRRPEAPAVTLRLPGTLLRIGDGGAVTVEGEPAQVLAWLSGRASGERLRTRPPGKLPAVPAMS